MPFELSRLSSTQLRALPPETTVFFIPVGPIEDHGPHLPAGLDLEEANQLCFLTAEKLEAEMPGYKAVILPQIPLGVDSDTTEIALTVRAHVLRDYLVDTCRALHRAGFRYFVCFSGHAGPRQLTTIEDAAKLLRSFWKTGLSRKKPLLLSASSVLVSGRVVLRSPLWPDPEEHAGARDTSIALALDKSSVDPAYRALPAQEREGSALTRLARRGARRISGYWGEPSEASAARGQEALFEAVRDVFPKIRAVLEGAPPKSLFRSWYGVFPPNRSFFLAWVLTAMIFLVMAVWFVWSLTSSNP
ncbi:MAG: creatininase family protein [Bdellovibrionota bacterium]